MEMFLALLPMVYISQLIRFARVCSNVDDFNYRNLFLTAELLKQGYRYHKKIVSEYDQEIPQSQTADNPKALRGRASQPSRDTKKTNLSKSTSSLSSPPR